MIISASRRTDIPAFYSEWFINRIRAGYCTVPNPFNSKQVSYVSLQPEDVEVIAFWTRNPNPLIPHLEELTERGHRFYFLFTVMDNPKQLDSKTPPLSTAIKVFQELSSRIGSDKVIWRYDPIVLSNITGIQYHIERYNRIAEALKGYSKRSIISIVDIYSKSKKRIRELAQNGINLSPLGEIPKPQFEELMNSIVGTAKRNGMKIVSCAEEIDLERYNVLPGKCIDDNYIEKIFGITCVSKKDPNQRAACGCVISKDIGMYNTCLFGCQYCYATSSFGASKANYERHDPASPSLIGWHELDKSNSHQLKLF